jgi:hypothetical protein
LKLTPQELKDLKLGEQVAGLYSQQCGKAFPAISSLKPRHIGVLPTPARLRRRGFFISFPISRDIKGRSTKFYDYPPLTMPGQ